LRRERDRLAAAAASFARLTPMFEGESEGDKDGVMEICEACDFLVLFRESGNRLSSSSIVLARDLPEACDLPARDDGFGVTLSYQ
jgi:hypothetical protein